MTDFIPEAKTQMNFEPQTFIRQFDGALTALDAANKLGSSLANQGITRMFFVGCGAPHYMMRVLAYWARRYARSIDIRNYFSAEFVNQAPLALDEHTLVVLGSHSGKTPETVAAAEFIEQKPCRSVAITQHPESPLGSHVEHVIGYGDSDQGYFSSYMLGQALVSAVLDTLESGWGYHDTLLRALPMFPNALANAKLANLQNAAIHAEAFSKDRLLYVVGAGPMFTTAYTFASCFLMEMQRIHAHPLVAAEFFHGPFEVVDQTTPLLVLVGEDPSRGEAERVVKFCEQYAGKHYVYDSKTFKMPGIPAELRPIFSPFVVDAALTALVEHLAVVRDHPLTLRRYMGKVAY